MGRALLAFASPQTQLLWRDHFSEAATTGPRRRRVHRRCRSRIRRRARTRLPLSSTAFIGGARPPAGTVAPEARAGWIPPVRSPLPSSSDPLLEVPRRFHPARWALGAGGLAAAALLIAVTRVASATRESRRRSSRPLDRAAAAPEGRAAPDVAQPEPIDELRPASSTHPVREARTAHRPRFGTNKSPLIE